MSAYLFRIKESRMNLKEFKTHFDPFLEAFLQEKIDEVSVLYPDQETKNLILYLLPYIEHGKRFRPYMVYLWYTMNGWKDIELCMKYWSINELIHVFALIHDDICDKGTLRHQIPTYHRELWSRYADEHVWLSQAMILWDLVYTWAVELLFECGGSIEINMLYMSMLKEVIVWQMLDIHYSRESTSRGLQDIEKKDHLKSWQYTFQKPMMIWAKLAGVDDQVISKIATIWREIWVAFQWRDDLLDWLPNKEWKTKFSDIQEGNQTALMIEFWHLLQSEDLFKLEGYRWSEITSEMIDFFETIIASSGIQKHMEQKIGDKLDWVEKDFLSQISTSDYSPYFLEIITLLRHV